MTNTILHHLATVEKHLLTSKTFWSSLSTAAFAGALTSFYSTQQYTNTFTNNVKYIILSVIITFHFIIIFSNPNTLKTTFAPYFLGPAKKWAIRITALRAAYMLCVVPEQSVVGVVFVVCVWIYAVAVGRIVSGNSNDMWFVNSVFMAVVNRSIDLYGFSGRYWLVMLFCFPLMYVQVRLEGYKSDEMKEKKG